MKNDPRTHGLWEASAPAAPVTSTLEGDVIADVVVVGAGFTGLSAALHLAGAGASAIVIEAEEIGFGGSGRNVGLLNAGMWVMPNDLLRDLGEVYGERLLTLLGDAPRVVLDLIERHAISCEAVHRGTLHCAVGSSGLEELKERERQWLARGAPVKLLDASQTAAKAGSNAYSGSLLDLRAGTVQPLAYARGLASAAIGAGAKIYTKSPVIDARETDGKWLVRTDRGSVRANWVIVATNAYTTDAWPQIRTELIHLPYFNLATKPLDAQLQSLILPERQGAWDTKEILSSFRFDQQGRFIFGSVGALRGAGRRIHPGWAKRAIRRTFPKLPELEFEHEWYGSIGMTTNNLPRFHRLGRSVVSFSGYNGRGIAPGTVFGKALAQLALGETDESTLPLPISEPEPTRFRAARERYYEVGAQIAHALADRI